MHKRSIPGMVFGAFLSVFAAAPAMADLPLPYVTITLDNYSRAVIHERRVALMRETYDEEFNLDADVWEFDNLQRRRLTRDGGNKFDFTLKNSDRYIAWASPLATGNDIFVYDRQRGAARNLSNTAVSEDPFIDLEDDHIAWQLFTPSFTEELVLSNGRRNVVVNAEVIDDYTYMPEDPQTSGGNTAFSAVGPTGSSDVFFYDGGQGELLQLTDSPDVNDIGTRMLGNRTAFASRREDGTGSFRIRVYDGRSGRTKFVASDGQQITGGHVLGSDPFNGPFTHEFDGDLLVWFGKLADGSLNWFVTNVRTEETRRLADVFGEGLTGTLTTSGGYVGAFVAAADGGTDVLVYHFGSGRVTTAGRMPPGTSTSGVISMSGPDVAYNYFDAATDAPKVAVHYRLDSLLRELFYD